MLIKRRDVGKESYYFSIMQKLYLLSVLLLASSFSEARTLYFERHEETEHGPRNWAYEVGVAILTPNRIKDFFGAGRTVRQEKDDTGGEIYSFTASHRLGQLVLNTGGTTSTLQFELPLTLEVVNENSGSPFVALASSISVRWTEFPWNQFLLTSFSMGLGLNFSTEIYKIDRERHPDEHRSHLKINWPIQATIALPRYPDDQLMIYIIHHSGGRLFDHGGLNALGIGYRRDF